MGLISKLTAIADAIRAKLGTTDKMTMDEMASNIEAIPVGSDTWDKYVSGNMESLTLKQESIPVGFLMGYQGGLKSLKITNAATVPNDAFKSIPETYAPQMVDVDFGDVVETIADNAFYGQEKIEKITGLNKLKGVGCYAFDHVGHAAVGTVEPIASGVFNHIANLSAGAFHYCSLISDIENTGYSGDIPQNCFYGCSNLNSVRYEEAKGVGSSALGGCKNLKSATFPKATSIGASAFSSDTSLEYVSLPLCKRFESTAFANGLAEQPEINAPNLEYIGMNCFNQCKAKQLMLSTGLTDQVVEIDDGAFNKCYQLESITLSFKNIPKNCFYYSYVLTDIYITNTTGVVTFSGTGHFSRCFRLFGTYDATYNPQSIKGAVHVPPNLLDAYKADTNWINNFIGDGGEIVAID